MCRSSHSSHVSAGPLLLASIAGFLRHLLKTAKQEPGPDVDATENAGSRRADSRTQNPQQQQRRKILAGKFGCLHGERSTPRKLQVLVID
jgi:hypothetical protein